MAVVSEGSTFKIDWDAIEKMARTVEGGSDQIDWNSLGTSEEEGKNLFGRAVDGVRGFLQKLHLPKFGREAAGVAPEPAVVAPEPEGAGRNRLFEWLGEQRQRANDWSVNTDRWLRGLPGGLVNRFKRQPEAGAAPQISREERIRALQEGTRQFVQQHGITFVGGLLGIAGVGAGAAVVSPENIGMVNSLIMEIAALGVSGMSLAGLIIGDARGPENIPQAEKAYQRPVRALQRLCSQKAVRTGLLLAGSSAGGFAVGGLGRIAVDTLQAIQQGVAAGVPAPTEAVEAWNVGGNVAPGQMTPDQLGGQIAQEAAQRATEAVQQVQQIVSQSTDVLAQANNTLAGISPDVTNDPGVQQASGQAQQAIEAYNQFSASAAAGGFDAGEAARLQQLATDAMNAANQVADTASQVAQQIAEAAQAAAAAADATETARQAALQAGDVMKNVIAATPSGTAFEALQQQAFQATGSPYAAEVANALSWALPQGDITGLHSGAIQEGAKTVAGLLQQAHDFAAANGGEYTVRAIRQAVTDGQLSQDVLHAVEAANLPAGADKNQAIEALNTVLQGVVK